jgi:arabinogalactan oligomer/maltooligosaccharide transport system substrate-binding protein
MRARILATLLALASCRGQDGPARGEVPLRFWHAFAPHETEALNRVLERAGQGEVETSLLSFARGQTILGQVLRAGSDCPDLARIDATWLPGLAALLAPVPDEVWRAREWLPEAAELTRYRDARLALPQALDGLALIHRRGALEAAGVSWPPTTLGELEAAASALTVADRHGLGVRVDGYWFIPFLLAAGGALYDPASGRLGLDEAAGREALVRYARLFTTVTPPPPAPQDAARVAVAEFQSGRVAIQMDGPWAVWELSAGAIDAVEVTPFPRAPDGSPAALRGGQLYVVPRCARAPARAWRLALALTDPVLQGEWGRRFGTVPTTRAGLERGGRVAGEFYRALEAARTLPRHPITAEVFDDLTPAIEAVVVGDASAEEALAGMRASWQRLLARQAR